MKVKISIGCGVFPDCSVIEVDESHKGGVLKFVENKANGFNFMPPNTTYEVFKGETTHFCTNCGKEFHEPENFEYEIIKFNYFTPKNFVKNLHNTGTCERCYDTLTKVVEG